MKLTKKKILYGGNVIFLCYVPNFRKMINYSRVPLNVFTKHFAKTLSKNLMQTSLTNVFHLKRVWLDTGGQCPAKCLIVTFDDNLLNPTQT